MLTTILILVAAVALSVCGTVAALRFVGDIGRD